MIFRTIDAKNMRNISNKRLNRLKDYEFFDILFKIKLAAQKGQYSIDIFYPLYIEYSKLEVLLKQRKFTIQRLEHTFKVSW